MPLGLQQLPGCGWGLCCHCVRSLPSLPGAVATASAGGEAPRGALAPQGWPQAPATALLSHRPCLSATEEATLPLDLAQALVHSSALWVARCC